MYRVVLVAVGRTSSSCSVPAQSLHCSATLGKTVPRNLKGKSKTSQDWLTRQLNDVYAKQARIQQYRARSAFKLLELQERYQFLKAGQGVVECGSAPGAWTQVLTQLCNSRAPDGSVSIKFDKNAAAGRVVGLDLLPVSPVPGAALLSGADFTHPQSQGRLLQLLRPHSVQVVASDMAPNAAGELSVDHDRIMKLAYAVANFALSHSQQGAHLVCKVWAGSRLDKFIEDLKPHYDSVKQVKPPCSRDNSAEQFVLARNLLKSGPRSPNKD